MMALMLVALTATGAGTLTLLHSYLQGQVDDKLRAAVDSVRQQRSFSQLQPTNPNVPTDYSLMLFSPGLPPFAFGGDKDSHPAITTFPRLRPGSASRYPSRCAAPKAATGASWPSTSSTSTSAAPSS